MATELPDGLVEEAFDNPYHRIAVARQLLDDAHQELSNAQEHGVAILTDGARQRADRAEKMLALRHHDAGRTVAHATEEADD